MNSWDIESKFRELENNLFQKVEKYEWHNQSSETNSRLDSLECALREARAEIDGLRHQLQITEENRLSEVRGE